MRRHRWSCHRPAKVDVDRGDFPATSPLSGPANADPVTMPRPAPSSVITAAAVPSISLQADVVVAKLIERDGVITWEVPGFKAGHAEYTGGAGEVGNAVLLGHVSSRSLGNVFKDLERVQVGDVVNLFSGPRQFHYRVVDIRSVPRTDVSVLQPTETASLSLITCTGVWLPFIWDYSDRLVVRAELLAPAMSD